MDYTRILSRVKCPVQKSRMKKKLMEWDINDPTKTNKLETILIKEIMYLKTNPEITYETPQFDSRWDLKSFTLKNGKDFNVNEYIKLTCPERKHFRVKNKIDKGLRKEVKRLKEMSKDCPLWRDVPIIIRHLCWSNCKKEWLEEINDDLEYEE